VLFFFEKSLYFLTYPHMMNGSGQEPRPCLMPMLIALITTQPPIQRVKGVLGVKRPVREADHSPPSSSEVKNTWSYTSTPHKPSWPGA
jgi:hypothetical protein